MSYNYDPTLYKLSGDYQYLLSLLQDDEADEQMIIDTLDGIEGLIEHKLEAYSIIISELQSRVDFFKKEEVRIFNRRRAIANNIDRMKDRMFEALRAVGLKKMETDHFTVSIQKNGGKQPLDIHGDVPEDYMTYVPKVDNEAIREALEAGEELDFATLQERGESLRIR